MAKFSHNFALIMSVAHTEVLKSIDRAIEAIHFEAKCTGGVYTQLHRTNLQKLQRHRQNVLDEHRASEALSLSPVAAGAAAIHSPSSAISSQPQRQAPAPPPAPVLPVRAVPTKKSTGSAERSPKRISVPPPPWSAAANPKVYSPPPANAHGPSSPPPPPSPSSTSTLAASVSTGTSTSAPADKGTRLCAVEANARSASASNDPGRQPATVLSPQKTTTTRTEVVQGLPEELCLNLLEQVRRNTKLSYDMSRVAVGTVLTLVRDNVPAVSDVMDQIIHQLLDTKSEGPQLEATQDAVRLQTLFQELTDCKDDSQQRSWFLHEDEATILSNLEEMLSILNNANPEICRTIVALDNYDAIQNLVLYYQMETRVSIRMLLLQTFGALCSLETRVISELLNSVLPLELARDMQADLQDIQRLSFSALVLTMLLSMGEAVPVHHYEHLNKTFIQFLLANVECGPESDEQEQVPDLFVRMLLAFNLHFELPAENLVMQVLAAQGTAKTFTEKLMLLVNRGDDPVRMFDHQPAPPDSLLKFLSDLYSSPDTANLLYTNDAMVLIDIILRHLCDLSPGDKVRTEYLSLFLLLLQSSDYAEHQHRRADLQVCLVRISREEEVDTDMDRHIVDQICRDFPQLFDVVV